MQFFSLFLIIIRIINFFTTFYIHQNIKACDNNFFLRNNIFFTSTFSINIIIIIYHARSPRKKST